VESPSTAVPGHPDADSPNRRRPTPNRPYLGVGLGGSIADVVELAVAAETAGFESAWVAELERSAFVQAAAIASATDQISIGTAVALAFPRSPTLMALEARDVDELSDGRFLLGLGTQVKRVLEARYSVPFEHPAEKLAEYARAVRVVWAAGRGESITHEGRFYRITMPTFHGSEVRERPDVPILFAAVGALMSFTAGTVADGVIGHPLASPRYLAEVVRPSIAEGLAAAGRPADACPLTASPLVAIADDPALARREAKLQIAFYATTTTYAGILRLHGREHLGRELRRAFIRGDREGMIALVDDELCDAIAVTGRSDEVRGRLTDWTGIAHRLILAGPWYGVPPGRARENAVAIVETFAGRSGPPEGPASG
jgi:probable F420-dependent oxidoreductase